MTALWVAPYFAFPELRPHAREAFDAEAMGANNRLLTLGLQFAGFVFVSAVHRRAAGAQLPDAGG
ncbi:MAG: hypothetical protein R2748_17430 [Bryobacterales bacterium]